MPLRLLIISLFFLTTTPAQAHGEEVVLSILGLGVAWIISIIFILYKSRSIITILTTIATTLSGAYINLYLGRLPFNQNKLLIELGSLSCLLMAGAINWLAVRVSQNIKRNKQKTP